MAEQEQEINNDQQDFTSDNFNTNIGNSYSTGEKSEGNNNNNNEEEESYNNDQNNDYTANNYDDDDDEADRLEPEQYRKLFIGSLNYVTSEETMRNYFGKYGDIVDCVIMKEPKTSKYVILKA